VRVVRCGSGGAEIFFAPFLLDWRMERRAGWRRKQRALRNSRVGKALGLRERTKRDFSTAQTDTFAGAKVEEKASVCFGRNDKFCGDVDDWATRD
jgi:hypothetical protein